MSTFWPSLKDAHEGFPELSESMKPLGGQPRHGSLRLDRVEDLLIADDAEKSFAS